MDKDLVVGIVGAVLLVGAMVAVFAYESQNAGIGGQTFAVTWATTDGSLPPSQGAGTEGGCEDVSSSVAVVNMTRLTFSLTWTDDVGDADTFTLTVVRPDGSQAGTRTGDTGTVDVVVEIQPIPTVTTAQGSDAADAAERVATANTSSTGQGEWAATVCLDAAPGVNAPVGGLPEIQGDGANAFTLTVKHTTYAASVREDVA